MKALLIFVTFATVLSSSLHAQEYVPGLLAYIDSVKCVDIPMSQLPNERSSSPLFVSHQPDAVVVLAVPMTTINELLNVPEKQMRQDYHRDSSLPELLAALNREHHPQHPYFLKEGGLKLPLTW